MMAVLEVGWMFAFYNLLDILKLFFFAPILSIEYSPWVLYLAIIVILMP